jgi:AcrR family transcriptional regulator
MPSSTERDAERRRTILDAALACFVQYGYAKTSLDDIARRANLSRPLLYRKYRNKEAIYGAVYDDVFDSRYPAAEEVLAGKGSRKDKLFRIYEILCVDTWAIVRDAPMAHEFYEACMQVAPEINEKHERKLLELTRKVLGSRELAEVLLLAVDGLFMDLPTVPVLRKRLRVLTDRFAG